MNRFDNIRQWAADRNLILGSDPKSQMCKLMEEVGELAAAIARRKEDESMDALGDSVVVLTILAAQLGFHLEDCIDAAWDEIKDRKGRMVYGVFIKESDES